MTEEIKWYETEDKGIGYRFIPVAPYMYSTIESHIRAELEKSKPVAPLLQKGSVLRQNEADGPYQDKLAIWQRYAAIVNELSNTDIAIIAGVVLRDPLPDKNTWLTDVIFQLELAGITYDDVVLPVSYMKPEKQLEYIYKKYIVLAGDLETTLFTAFFNKNTKEALTTVAKAVNMFRSNEGEKTDAHGEAE